MLSNNLSKLPFVCGNELRWVKIILMQFFLNNGTECLNKFLVVCRFT